MPESLKRQLEMTRFDRALQVSESMAQHRVLLTTGELARLNLILVGKEKDPYYDSWRKGPATLQLPSGKTETLQLITDPKATVRDRLHRATELADSLTFHAPDPEKDAAAILSAIDAAVDVYVGLVLAHPFEDANRRTAVLASHYFLCRYGVPISGLALHELGLGDLRQEGQVESLRETIHQMAKFSARRK